MSDIILLSGSTGSTFRRTTGLDIGSSTPQAAPIQTGNAGMASLTADGSTVFITLSVSDSNDGDTAPMTTISIRSDEWVNTPAVVPGTTPFESWPWVMKASEANNPTYERTILLGKNSSGDLVLGSPDRSTLYLTGIQVRKITGVSGNEATTTEITNQINNKVKDFARVGEQFNSSDLPSIDLDKIPELPLSKFQQTDIDKIEGSADASTLSISGKRITIQDNEQVPTHVDVPFQTQAEVDQRIADSANEHGSTGSGTTSQAKIDARVRSDDNAATGTQRGNIELATSDETIQGTNQNKAVTPKAAKDARDQCLLELLTFETALKETTVLVTNEAVTQAVSGASQAFSGRPKLPANEFDRRLYGTINGTLAWGIFIKDLENRGGVNTEGAQLNSGNSLQVRNIELAENYFISYLTSDRTLLFASDTTDTYRVTVAESSVDLEDFARRSKTDLVKPEKLATGTRDGTKFLRDDQTWQEVQAGTQGIGGVTVKDEGNPLGTPSTVDSLNFTGSAITATRSGNEVSVDVQASSGGSSRTGFIEKRNPASTVRVSSVNGVWSDWTDLVAMPAITSEQAGQVLLLSDVHVDSVGSPSGGGDRIISDAKAGQDKKLCGYGVFMTRRFTGRGTCKAEMPIPQVVSKTPRLTRTSVFAVADDALEGDVYKVQVRIIAQKPNETQSGAMFNTHAQPADIVFSWRFRRRRKRRGLTTSQVNALIANYAKATPSGRMNEAQLPQKLDDLLDAINSAGWDDLETSRVSTPKSTSFAQGDFTGLVWVASRSESPARSTSYYPVRLLLADKQKATDKAY